MAGFRVHVPLLILPLVLGEAAHRCPPFDTYCEKTLSNSQQPQPPVQPPVLGPNVNGINISDPGLPAIQKFVQAGFVDATKAPFNADNTGTSDATNALQAALDFGRAHYLTTFLPGGTYLVSESLTMIQAEKKFLSTVGTPDCNNMVETFGGTPTLKNHCGRTQPYVFQGTMAGTKRSKLLVKRGSNFQGYVVHITNPINENVNMNQVMSSIDIVIETGNPNAMGIYARGAQGVSVQDVTIFAGDAAIGLDGGAGSGGSHTNVTVIGGLVGMRLSTAQPSPTLSAIRLINQTGIALLYGNPGRQTLSVVGVSITALPEASGPAISSSHPLSIVDAQLHCPGIKACACAINASGPGSNLYLNNVYFQGFSVAVSIGAQSSHPVPVHDASHWTHIGELAVGQDIFTSAYKHKSTIFLNGVEQKRNTTYSLLVEGVDDRAPPATLIEQHQFPANFPSWQTSGACNAKTDYGARGDLVTDDTKALQAMLDDAKCDVAFLPKGYYALSRTLTMRAGQAIVGAGRIFTNIVVHSSAKATIIEGEDPWPLIETADDSAVEATNVARPADNLRGEVGPNTIAFLSVIVWKHVNASYAVHFRGATTWRRAHTNRVDLSPGKSGPYAYYNHPLNVMSGGREGGLSRFYNFYQENWNSQGPLYRHLLVSDTGTALRCYHCNTEHSQGEANLEIANAQGPIAIYGFKGEGNYAQIWARNVTSLFLLGYGGNASPFPFHCPYPPGYAAYQPSLLRIERVATLRLVNINSQLGKEKKNTCGQFHTGFAGLFYDPATWRSILEIPSEGENVSTPAQHWPVLYRRLPARV